VPHPARRRWNDPRLAALAWAGVFAVVAAIVLAGNRRTVTGNYRDAAFLWFQGKDLYEGAIRTGHGFLYLPQAAILFAPFAWLPLKVGEIAWRALSMGAFAIGIRRYASLAGREAGAELFPLVTALSLPLAFSCFRNGQSTVLIAALMMIAVADIAEERWGRAAAWLSLGFALKPLVLVLTLLSGALYRPLRWRLLAGTAVVLAFPFLFQSPAYVAGQYRSCLAGMQATARLGIESYWAHFFGMLKVGGLSVSPSVQTGVRILAAGGTLGLCLLARRRCTAAETGVWLYALAACYLMLFNPRTENNSYAMLGPAIAAFCGKALLVERRPKVAFALALSVAAILGSHQITRWITPPPRSIWLAPLACAGFLAFLAFTLATRKGTPGRAPGAAPP
jgi:hypothetical protein